jgi:hypothetical protein
MTGIHHNHHHGHAHHAAGADNKVAKQKEAEGLKPELKDKPELKEQKELKDDMALSGGAKPADEEAQALDNVVAEKKDAEAADLLALPEEHRHHAATIAGAAVGGAVAGIPGALAGGVIGAVVDHVRDGLDG